MKKSVMVVAVAGAFASCANAQSSVTLYGLVDAGLTYTSNVDGHARWAQSGGAEQSRWGMRGVEDLGGGLKTVFNLESGFNVNNGSQANAGRLFGRQAFVGVKGDFGTVTLGRQYDAVQDYLSPISATGSWGGTYFAHPFNNDNLNTNGGFSVNNSVKFTSADYAGFTFGGTYGFSNQAGFANNREYSAGAGYANHGLRIGAAYAQQNNPGSTSVGATDQTAANDLVGVAGNFRQRQFGAGASYAFGPATLGMVWTQSRLDNFVVANADQYANNWEINGSYNVTPALNLGAAFSYTNMRVHGPLGDNKLHYYQVGLQSDYALSRRTDVYAQAVYQHTTTGGDPATIYTGAGDAFASANHNQTLVTVGLRHRF